MGQGMGVPPMGWRQDLNFHGEGLPLSRQSINIGTLGDENSMGGLCSAIGFTLVADQKIPSPRWGVICRQSAYTRNAAWKSGAHAWPAR